LTVLASAIDLKSVSSPNDMGYFNTGAGRYCYVAARSTANGGNQCACFSTPNIISSTGIQTAGYVSMNRTGATAQSLYYASPDIGHSSIGSESAGQTQSPDATLSIYLGAARTTGAPTYTKNTISFAAIHQGLTIAESSTFASLIFTLRTALGGGTGSYGDAAATYWSARTVASGGVAPGSTSRAAISNFVATLQSAGILSKMVSACAFAPDNLIASITPCIYMLTDGSNSYVNHNFVLGDLSVNGLVGNATNKYLDTGIIPSTQIGGASSGQTLYAFTASATGNSAGSASNANANWLQNTVKFSDNTCVFRNGAIGNLIFLASPGAGYYSANRITTTDHRAFFANSTNVHAQIGSTDATNYAGAGSSAAASLFAINLSGVISNFCSDRLSFAGYHTGLTQAQSLTLFNAVVAMRTALGGGTV
jgi:hypothetical protein